MAGEGTILPHSVLRNLGDKLYDKRKGAALEVEHLVKELRVQGNDDRLKAIIQVLSNDFACSPQSNNRKGGLIGLAAMAIGLMQDTGKFLDRIVPPVLKCLLDQEARVRYYACEALYNVSKVSRSGVLVYFNEIFDALCKLSADADLGVKNGAQLLDRLIKDIVTESESFSVDKFIPLLRQRIRIINPYVRQFLVSWITVLDSVPDIDMLQFLPEFLEGLFNMLSDSNKEIRQQADSALAEFMREIKHAECVEYGPMVKILVLQCGAKDKNVRLTALTWLNEFISLGKEKLISFVSDVLATVLPCISHQQEEIREAALKTNENVLELISTSELRVEIGKLLNVVTTELSNNWVLTRLASLQWISMLLKKAPKELLTHIDEIFPVLLHTLCDSSDEVARVDLEVLARISMHDQYFQRVLSDLIKSFSTDRELLENRGSLIIRQLCVLLDPEKIYRTFASLLEHEEDLEFASVMVQTLNLILLTATEFFELRSLLRRNLDSKAGRDLFVSLYQSWTHNPVATFSLCLLGQAYEHASTLVYEFAEIEVTVGFLVQIDKLVQLLESPIFTYLRLQLLEPSRNPHLVKCLYGLLMLLPQSSAFHSLKNRLESVQALGMLHMPPESKFSTSDKTKGSKQQIIDFDALLRTFKKVQEKHTLFRTRALKEGNMSIFMGHPPSTKPNKKEQGIPGQGPPKAPVGSLAAVPTKTPPKKSM